MNVPLRPLREAFSTGRLGVNAFALSIRQRGTYVPRMFLIRLVLIIAVITTGGCAWGKRSSSRIVEGDSSNIKYTNREDAGGPIGGR